MTSEPLSLVRLGPWPKVWESLSQSFMSHFLDFWSLPELLTSDQLPLEKKDNLPVSSLIQRQPCKLGHQAGDNWVCNSEKSKMQMKVWLRQPVKTTSGHLTYFVSWKDALLAVLTWINTWEINWNNWFSAGIKVWQHKGKCIIHRSNGAHRSSEHHFLCFRNVCSSSVLPLWPLTFGLLPVVMKSSLHSFCC